VRYRLLAIDADGTLVDSGGALRPAVREAIRDVRAAGVTVVLCTGRRYRTARPLLEALDLSGPVIVQNGAVVKEAETGETLHASYVPRAAYERALSAVSELGPPAVYVDPAPGSGIDLFAERSDAHHPFLAEYLQANREQTRFVDSLAEELPHAVTMIIAMAEQERLLEVERRLADDPIASTRTNLVANKSYRGHILEIVSGESGKWRRLREIAQRLDVDDDDIVAIGDDTNDREMIERAGLGIAQAIHALLR
jgi:Cof subfamily protein (haloacid dehalogenase superfamily)